MSEKIALVVEDTPANRIFFERLLQQANYKVISAATGKEALEQVNIFSSNEQIYGPSRPVCNSRNT